MKISEALNLVIPCYDDDDNVYAYVHSVPLARETWESNYLLMSKTFTKIYREGLGELAGPRIAAYAMREIAESMSDDPASIIDPVMNEIRRLTHVFLATPSGWDTMTLHDALNRKLLQEEDAAAATNAIVFFTLLSAVLPRRRIKEVLPGMAMLWSAVITSSNATHYHASLPILTGVDSSGATAAQVAHREFISSVPS